MNKYCRICWNTNDWQHPSGEAQYLETGESYVTEKGFGHEEWLFNFGWLLSGFKKGDTGVYRYGFLQPINKYRSFYVGETFSVLLYTVSPTRNRLIVSRIDELYIPTIEELKWAVDEIESRGWLAIMLDDLRRLGINGSPLIQAPPSDIANVRFEPRKVQFFDPRPIVIGDHKILRINRYQPLNWDDGFPNVQYTPPIVGPPAEPDREDDFLRSEARRTRAAMTATAYDPTHDKLQNALYFALCDRYGREAVCYEEDFVDLVVKESSAVTFIEVKTEPATKRCIRGALGQLMEYSHYPRDKKADRLLIVGESAPEQEDIEYLAYLRKTYGLPLYYAQWDWADKALREAV